MAALLRHITTAHGWPNFLKDRSSKWNGHKHFNHSLKNGHFAIQSICNFWLSGAAAFKILIWFVAMWMWKVEDLVPSYNKKKKNFRVYNTFTSRTWNREVHVLPLAPVVSQPMSRILALTWERWSGNDKWPLLADFHQGTGGKKVAFHPINALEDLYPYTVLNQCTEWWRRHMAHLSSRVGVLSTRAGTSCYSCTKCQWEYTWSTVCRADRHSKGRMWLN